MISAHGLTGYILMTHAHRASCELGPRSSPTSWALAIDIWTTWWREAASADGGQCYQESIRTYPQKDSTSNHPMIHKMIQHTFLGLHIFACSHQCLLHHGLFFFFTEVPHSSTAALRTRWPKMAGFSISISALFWAWSLRTVFRFFPTVVMMMGPQWQTNVWKRHVGENHQAVMKSHWFFLLQNWRSQIHGSPFGIFRPNVNAAMAGKDPKPFPPPMRICKARKAARRKLPFWMNMMELWWKLMEHHRIFFSYHGIGYSSEPFFGGVSKWDP